MQINQSYERGEFREALDLATTLVAHLPTDDKLVCQPTEAQKVDRYNSLKAVQLTLKGDSKSVRMVDQFKRRMTRSNL